MSSNYSSSGPAAAAKARHSKQPRSGPVAEPPAKRARKTKAPKKPAQQPMDGLELPWTEEEEFELETMLAEDLLVGDKREFTSEDLKQYQAVFDKHSLAGLKSKIAELCG